MLNGPELAFQSTEPAQRPSAERISVTMKERVSGEYEKRSSLIPPELDKAWAKAGERYSGEDRDAQARRFSYFNTMLGGAKKEQDFRIQQQEKQGNHGRALFREHLALLGMNLNDAHFTRLIDDLKQGRIKTESPTSRLILRTLINAWDEDSDNLLGILADQDRSEKKAIIATLEKLRPALEEQNRQENEAEKVIFEHTSIRENAKEERVLDQIKGIGERLHEGSVQSGQIIEAIQRVQDPQEKQRLERKLSELEKQTKQLLNNRATIVEQNFDLLERKSYEEVALANLSILEPLNATRAEAALAIEFLANNGQVKELTAREKALLQTMYKAYRDNPEKDAVLEGLFVGADGSEPEQGHVTRGKRGWRILEEYFLNEHVTPELNAMIRELKKLNIRRTVLENESEGLMDDMADPEEIAKGQEEMDKKKAAYEQARKELEALNKELPTREMATELTRAFPFGTSSDIKRHFINDAQTISVATKNPDEIWPKSHEHSLGRLRLFLDRRLKEQEQEANPENRMQLIEQIFGPNGYPSQLIASVIETKK